MVTYGSFLFRSLQFSKSDDFPFAVNRAFHIRLSGEDLHFNTTETWRPSLANRGGKESRLQNSKRCALWKSPDR